jgi:DNA polymerase (family 10)
MSAGSGREGTGSPSRSRIAAILNETANLLELKGENPFRARAYSNGARAVEGTTADLQELYEAGTLSRIQGIGSGLVDGIAELLQTGRLTLHEELKAGFPKGVLDLLRVPGLGPKRLRTLIDQLEIDSVAALEAACRDGRVAALPGFGAKSQEKLLAGLASQQRYAERHRLPDALEVAERFRARLAAFPGVGRAEIAGSARRRLETIGDIDLIATVAGDDDEQRLAIADRFLALPDVVEKIERGPKKSAALAAGGFRVDLRLFAPDEVGAAWLHFTGSKEHNIRLRSRAKERGLSLNEYGLFGGDEKRLESESEAAIYHRLGLAWIPPEAREAWGEIELATAAHEAGEESIPEPVRFEEIRGTFHVHSTWSDGIATVPEMAKAAAELGWEYLGIADHSKAAVYAGGLDAERVRAQWSEIDAWNAAGKPPRLFKGTECDILADGALDFDDELLTGFDYVVVSVHSRFSLSRDAMTERLLKAVSHPRVTFLGHATGRLLLMREPYDLDLDAVLDAAAANGVIVELNANAHRLDLDWRQLRGWFARGLPTSIHPDAHSPQGLADVRWGVDVARKALTSSAQVLNCRPLSEIESYLALRRERAAGLGR